MKFYPEEVIFLPTTQCNLSCRHCNVTKTKTILSQKQAIRFLRLCNQYGIQRVGFSGGEPFLTPHFLFAVTEESVKLDMVFDRIMTNGVWFKNKKELRTILSKLYASGYDGTLSVSVDIFHKQDLKKVVCFIQEAWSIWQKDDIVSIAYVGGLWEDATRRKIVKVARHLGGKVYNCCKSNAYIKNRAYLIRLHRIDFSPTADLSHLKNPWNGKWFKEDYCQGPGNVFFVLPDGSVRPCCGYANEAARLKIGDIHNDSVEALMRNVKNNRFVYTVFNSGLSSIRKRLEKRGMILPGKTTNHCYFCYYLLQCLPKQELDKVLD